MDDNTSVLEELIQKNGVGTGTLLGVDGNAYALMGYTQGKLRRANWPREDIEKVMEIAESSDYNNVIRTCMRVLDGEDSE